MSFDKNNIFNEEHLAGGYSTDCLNLIEDIQNLKILTCSACRALEERNYDFNGNKTIQAFWTRHKQYDQARLDAENKEKSERLLCIELCDKPISSLTTEDKNLLRKYKYL